MRKSRIKNKKRQLLNILIPVWITLILLISVGFASYSSTLKITGSALVNTFLDEYVKITNAEIVEKTDTTVSNSLSITNDTVTSSIYTPRNNSYIKYAITVTNTTPTDAFITRITPVVYNLLDGTKSSVHKYEILNLVENETIVPARSSYTFYIKISYNGTNGVNTDVTKEEGTLNSTFKLNVSKSKEYLLTINATPADSTITVKSNNQVVASGTGTVSKLFPASTNIEYTVEKYGYVKKTKNYTTTNVDEVLNIKLNTAKKYNYTINPTPTDALVTIKNGNDVLISGFGTQTMKIANRANITYEVSKQGYKTKTGTYQINGKEHTENIVLEKEVYIPVKYVNDSNTDSKIAKTGTFNVPKSGVYLFELWGGTGGKGFGNNGAAGGNAGYLHGTILLNQGTIINYTLGGNGETGNENSTISPQGGANGGAHSNNDKHKNSNANGGGGGGYSAVMIDTNIVNQTNIDNGSVLFISGGSGGGGGTGGRRLRTSGYQGGNGGNINSTQTQVASGIVFNGEDGKTNSVGSLGIGFGSGGTNVGGDTYAAVKGEFLKGGYAIRRGGGGGAGYYGGGGGAGDYVLGSQLYGPSGGGGGSSYVSSKVKATGLTPEESKNLVNVNPSKTGGGILITWLSPF